VETSAREPLISTRLFAVTKWSAWQASKESLVSQAPSPDIPKSATTFTAPPAVVCLQTAHKNTRFTKTLCSQYNGKTKQSAGMSAYGQLGSATGWQWASTTPWILQECLHMVKWGVRRVASEPPRATGYYRNVCIWSSGECNGWLVSRH
jgi:hypothetical protein